MMKRPGTIACACMLLLSAMPLRAQQAPAYSGFDHVAIAVADVARSRDFYAKVFGAEVWKDSATEQRYLQLGQSHLALDVQDQARIDHVGFGVEAFDAAAAQRWLAAQSIPWI
ncbi:MAG: VOC family protein, partial [Gammaproteobacteria bacterium]